MSRSRRLAPALIGAAAAGIAAIVVGILTHPYAEDANAAHRHGAQTGLVLRYIVLGALAGYLIGWLVRYLRMDAPMQRAIGDWPVALRVLGLLIVGLLGVVPLFAGGYGDDDQRTDFRAGFIDGCSKNAPAPYCECLYSQFEQDPATDTVEERMAAMRRIQETRSPTPELRRAAAACADKIAP
jgi:hypothetical protein